MTLRWKTVLFLCLVSAALLVLQSLGANLVLESGYQKLEEKDARRNLGRVQNLFQDQLEQMDRSVGSLAQRMETHRFMNEGGDFEARYLPPSLFAQAAWDFVLLIDRQGRIRIGKGYDAASNRLGALPVALQGETLETSLGFQPAQQETSRMGVWRLGGDPYMYASQWILSPELGGPPAGLLIAGRAITAETVRSLSESLRLDVRIAHIYRGPAAAEQTYRDRATRDLQNPKFFNIDDEFTRLFLDVEDREGNAALQLEVVLKRDFFQQARAHSVYLFATVLIIGLIFSALVYLIIDRLVLARITRLSRDIGQVKAAQSFEGRVRSDGSDELGQLGDTINEMLAAQERLHTQIKVEQKKTEDLLLNILPRQVVDRLKEDASAIAERYNDVTILFADIVGFTQMSGAISPEELVRTLNTVFSGFDQLVQKHGLEKIKTIGDAYMVVGGLPERRVDHAQALAQMALDMLAFMEEYNRTQAKPLQIRIGLHSGPVVAGVIGTRKFLYDLWGDAVNTASRMESSGLAGAIQVSTGTYQILRSEFDLESRGFIEVKGKGSMETYLLKGKKNGGNKVA